MIHDLYANVQDIRKRKLDQLFFDPFFFTAAVSTDGTLKRPKDESFDVTAREQSGAPSQNAAQQPASVPTPTASGPAVRRGTVPPPIERAPDIMRLDEAAAYLRLSPNRVRLLARNGVLPVARIGRTQLFRKAALLAWVRARE